MDVAGGLLQGSAVALTPINLFWCFVGVFLGTVVGVMPGLGPPATIAMLLPLTFQMNPTSAIIMLAGIYYGAKYGGSTTSILLNVPGESASVVTCLDGFAMARRGRAGAALGIAAIASFVAGTFGVLGLMLVAPPLARFALSFSSPGVLRADGAGAGHGGAAGRPLARQGPAGHAGGTVDRQHGHRPLHVDLALHLRALGAAGRRSTSWWWRSASSPSARCWPTWRRARPRPCCPCRGGCATCCRAARSSARAASPSSTARSIGFLIGVLPGAGSTIASFLSYGLEKAVSRHPEQFGTGVPEGVAAPEGANNSETGGALVPMLTLAIPGSATTAILLARPDPVGVQARAADDPGESCALLGAGGEHVRRQRAAAGPEHPADPAVRPDPEIAGPRPVPGDLRHLHRRGLQRVGQPASTCGCWWASGCSATACASSTIRRRR